MTAEMTADQIELMKRQIETQLDEYEQALLAYARFMGRHAALPAKPPQPEDKPQ